MVPVVKSPSDSVDPVHGSGVNEDNTSLSTIEDSWARSKFVNSSTRFHIACSKVTGYQMRDLALAN